MEYIFINYPKCGTCKKAKACLEEQNVRFTSRHIVEDNPKAEELKTWINESGLPIKRFFNTSGLKYKELNLKDRLPSMTDEEKINLLASDGMLVKRPILLFDGGILVGFKKDEWEALLKK